MIKNIILLSCLFIAFSGNVYSQSNDLYIVINEATWCKYCKANGERIHALIDEYTLGKQILVVSNDLTNKETISKSKIQLKNIGVSDFMEKHQVAAVVYLFDAKTKSMIDNFSIKRDNEQILKQLRESLEKVKG